MKTLIDAQRPIKVGRFSICEDRGHLYIRYWDTYQQKTIARKLEAKAAPAAKKEARALIR